MPHAGREQVIAELRERIGRMEGTALRRTGVLPFGVPDLDSHLPGGGLALGALHEVMGGEDDQASSAALFVAAILARHRGPVLWCLASRDLFAPALAGVGLHPDRVVYAETWRAPAVLAALEEGLRHPGLAGVVGEVARLGLTPSRRLQLAAETSGVPAFVLRRGAGEPEPTAALTRWRVTALPSAPWPTHGIGRARWQVELLRCRGTEPNRWTLSAPDAAGRLTPPAELGHGSRAPQRARRMAAG